MVPVTLRWDLKACYMLPAAIVAGCPVLTWLALDHLGTPTLALAGVMAVIVAVYVGLWHPLWLYWGLAVVLAIIPFGYVPGVHLPLYLPFAFGVVLAAILYPRPEEPFSRLEIAMMVMVVAAGISVVATSFSLGGMIQYVRWSIVTLVAVALLRLPREHLERFGRIFVWLSAANAIWGILLVTVDRGQKSFGILKVFGYDLGRVDESVRGGLENLSTFVYTTSGERSIRLGGTWVGANGAGIAFLIAFAMCLVLFRGWQRNCMAIILAFAILLTLSRQSIFTLFVGLALVFVFHSIRARSRWQAMGSVAVLLIVALSVPFIRERLLVSGSSDVSGVARTESLASFTSQVSGHWLFGLGWTRPEIIDPAQSYALNIISNAPLLQIYRAGLITGLAFIAVVVIGCILSYRALRSDSLPFAVYGGVFIAFCFVALQLDHGVADVPQTTLCFSVLLAFLGYVDRSRRETRDPAVDVSKMPAAAAP
ncbi:MAG: polysaccharide biosynthesis protein PslJ [Mycobacterium sp.]|nr:polysaccharide biosynthesis protein PslJ [Mycobacterium sp.]